MGIRYRQPEATAPYTASVDAFAPEVRVAECGIRADGLHHRHQPYRYEQLRDSLEHARTSRAAPDADDEAARPAQAGTPTATSNAEHALMASLGIQSDGRTFRFAGYRYTRLTDAVNYARRARGPDRRCTPGERRDPPSLARSRGTS